mmetsp:Transcript_33779/g.36410  ORF Transcript_33779/g.36410 Transcript_33779/m.36410 type:complete len:196 (+) Transcript_33779:537-1124(+)
MAISFILVLLGMSVIATSSFDIAGGTVNENEMDVMIYIAITSFLLFGTLTVFKFKFANVLNSESLYKDGVCSLIGTILSAALFANTLIIKAKPEIWWLDPFVAMICGFAALFIGIHSIFVSWKHRRVPICSLSWWLMSRGDGGRRNNNTIYNDEDNNEPAMSPIEKSERTSELEMNVKESNSGGLESTNLSGEVV